MGRINQVQVGVRFTPYQGRGAPAALTPGVCGSTQGRVREMRRSESGLNLAVRGSGVEPK